MALASMCIKISSAVFSRHSSIFFIWGSGKVYSIVQCGDCDKDVWYAYRGLYNKTKIVSEYDQEIPQSQTADNPEASRGRAAQPSQDTRKTN